MKVLSVASEAVPLAKTGGLADVVGALPAALSPLGVEMKVLLPGYPAVMAAVKKPKTLHRYADLFGGAASVLAFAAQGMDVLALDAPHLFDRPGGPYGPAGGGDWPDNWRRYAALGKAGADIASGVLASWRPDILHAHDWQAAMAPAYLRFGAAGQGVPSVMTVHNLAFQGQFAATIFPELGLPPEAMALDGVEYYGGVGFLKAGLQSASAITTVSPTYAQEIRTPAFGMGLDGLLRLRAGDVSGILNGIDTVAWDPASDAALAAAFSPTTLKRREANRRAVEERFGIEPGDGPLACVVSRLTWQKGMDLLAAEFDRLIGAGLRLAILGSGDRALEGALLAAAARHRGRAGVVIGYDEGLSHLMQGGCDAILIPSRFEPCGLTQLYGLRYGCVPVVARTGGLADTVVDANEAAVALGAATGVVFAPDSGEALVDGVRRAASLFADRKAWTTMQKQGMRSDVSWQRSAQKYANLYRALAAKGA
jgi:starch synthase